MIDESVIYEKEKTYIPARDPRELNVKKKIDTQSIIKNSLPDVPELLASVVRNYVVESENPETPTQPDWDQVEESAPDYIKNRPFGKAKGKVLGSISNKSFTLTDGVYRYSEGILISPDDIYHNISVRVEVTIYGNTKIYDDIPGIPTYMGGGMYSYSFGGDDYPLTIDFNSISYRGESYSGSSLPISMKIIDLSQIGNKNLSVSEIDMDSLVESLTSSLLDNHSFMSKLASKLNSLKFVQVSDDLAIGHALTYTSSGWVMRKYPVVSGTYNGSPAYYELSVDTTHDTLELNKLVSLSDK